MTSRGLVAETDEIFLDVDELEGDDVQVRQAGHDVGVGLGVLLGGVGSGEGGRGGEGVRLGTEVGDGCRAGVLSRRIRDAHVLQDGADVGFFGGGEGGGEVLDGNGNIEAGFASSAVREIMLCSCVGSWKWIALRIGVDN